MELVDLTGQTDFVRVQGGGGLQLRSELSPGDYILQVTVTDVLTKEPQVVATEWIDFEIVM